ncbi:UNVERIFIED_CONTAM: hypothetical protein HDU68_002969, partial [Siphonaria sp. JEL0065]
RIQFNTFASPKSCPASLPTNITELTGNPRPSTCLKNLSNFTVFDPHLKRQVQYVGERLATDLHDKSLYRVYFRDTWCTSYITSTHFNAPCVDDQSAIWINEPRILQTTLSGKRCNGTITSVKYALATDICVASTACDTSDGMNSMVSCVDEVSSTLSSQSFGDSTRRRVVLSHFMDPNCTVPGSIESLALNTCQNSLHLPTDSQSFSVVANADGKNVIYTLYADRSCTIVVTTVQYSGLGACMNSVRGVLSTFEGVGGVKSGTNVPILLVSIAGGLILGGVIIRATLRRNQRKPTEETSGATEEESGYLLQESAGASIGGSGVGNNSQFESLPEVETVQVLFESDDDCIAENGKESKEKVNPLFAPLAQRQMEIKSVETGMKEDDLLEQIGHETHASINPHEWTVSQVAEFVSKNGGTLLAVFEEKIDGMALVELSVENLYEVLRISAVEDQLKFRCAVERLTAAPPTYDEA